MTKDCFVDDLVSFGSIPSIEKGKINIPSGRIRLKFGYHNSGTDGFGIVHIWTKHKSEISNLNNGNTYFNVGDVPNYVEDIIQPGSSIYTESVQSSRILKLLVFKKTLGIAILRLNRPRGSSAYYSVTTAYPAQPTGVIVGNII